MISGQRSGKTDAPHSLQQEIEALGLEIFARMQGEKPGVFRSITGRLMGWSMRNEALKTQLFRFVDVLPTLIPPVKSRGTQRNI